jgi:membrane protease YdiL (CAAX protease family)
MAATFAFYLVLGFFSGPLFEEPGWRGFALPRLELAHGPLVGTLILGVLWGAWHLPQFLVPEWAAQNGGSDLGTIAAFLLLVLTLSPLLTWVYNRTGSLWMAMVTHAGINASLSIVPATSVAPMAVGIVAFGAISIALLIATRGRLGFDPAVPPSESTR